ncbi:hypothetical protein [Bifidobacterium pseudolongum]|uniref:Uncharacterized protein n=1 Tax=Bifidobacterium pseudolongum subsp. globosum TaxID=1690 RepID=A0A4V1Y4R0_9BIFI|nr:hypothetical protein [Bifidobacterium pseudolongum]RYQ36634.1 hypothetical protein PG2003B_1133 [Bifidobacterium pseudolongum subsp. globosum]
MPRAKKTAEPEENPAETEQVEVKPVERMETFISRTLDGHLFKVTRNIDTGQQTVEPA